MPSRDKKEARLSFAPWIYNWQLPGGDLGGVFIRDSLRPLLHFVLVSAEIDRLIGFHPTIDLRNRLSKRLRSCNG